MNVTIPLQELAPDVKDALQKRCVREGRTLNDVAKEILCRGVSKKSGVRKAKV